MRDITKKGVGTPIRVGKIKALAARQHHAGRLRKDAAFYTPTRARALALPAPGPQPAPLEQGAAPASALLSRRLAIARQPSIHPRHRRVDRIRVHAALGGNQLDQ